MNPLLERAKRIRRFAPLLLLASIGCSDGNTVTPPEPFVPIPTSLQTREPELTLYVPSTGLISATVRDQAGEAMPGQPLTFTSRDPSTVSVDIAGVATAVAGGQTWVVIHSGELSDSCQVTVRYHVLRDEAVVRIVGPNDRVTSLEPYGTYFDLMGNETDDRLRVAFYNEGWPDTTFVLLLPGVPQPGTFPTERSDPAALAAAEFVFDMPSPFAYAIIDDGEESFIYFPKAGSGIEVDVAQPAPGLNGEGVIEGRLSLQLDGYAVDYESQAFIPTGAAISAYLDFSTDFDHWGIGQATIEFEGGPSPVPSTTRWAFWEAFPNNLGLLMGQIHLDEDSPDVVVWMPGPPEGEVPIGAARPGVNDNIWIPSVTASWSGALNHVAYSETGTAYIDRVVEPVDGLHGAMHGSLSTNLSYWRSPGSEAPFGTGSLSMEFHVPIDPESAWRSPARVAMDGRSLWRPLFQRSEHRIR